MEIASMEIAPMEIFVDTKNVLCYNFHKAYILWRHSAVSYRESPL